MIAEVLNGPGRVQGYRSIWHTLQQRGIRVTRREMEKIIQKLNPEGVQNDRHMGSKEGSMFAQVAIRFGMRMVMIM